MLFRSTVHKVADVEHTKAAAKVVARYATTPQLEKAVRVAAHSMVRFKIAKFEGIYREYSRVLSGDREIYRAKTPRSPSLEFSALCGLCGLCASHLFSSSSRMSPVSRIR